MTINTILDVINLYEKENEMTINRALHTILDEVEIDENYSDNNIEFTRSWNYILDRLGVCFDSETENFVTQDTGDVI